MNAATENILRDLALRAHLADRQAPERMAGWRYRSFAALLLAEGRLFTPGVGSTVDVPEHHQGATGTCYVSAALWSMASGLAYVEGYSSVFEPMPTEHAWCSGPAGRALDPTWTEPGLAYIGLPVSAEYRRSCREVALLAPHPAGLALLQYGLPDEIRADVGRPLPAILPV
ncbi:hypothetical protein AB0M43_38305 [Longispora sp. NPDC051575]|uniref:hypothetical protein n=1 Tax=Longispora sp. NPDC051575 TaxID=3154943 RepID=UPI003428CB9F